MQPLGISVLRCVRLLRIFKVTRCVCGGGGDRTGAPNTAQTVPTPAPMITLYHHSFHKYPLSAYCVPGTLPSPRETPEIKADTSSCLHGDSSPVGRVSTPFLSPSLNSTLSLNSIPYSCPTQTPSPTSNHNTGSNPIPTPSSTSSLTHSLIPITNHNPHIHNF